MKRISYISVIGAALLSAVIFTGCSEDIQDAVDEYRADTQGSGSTILYSDGTTMGVTRAENQVNGGFSIYHIGTGEVIGFIGADGSVNDIGGRNLGVCQGATVSDNGLSGDCIVPTANPYQSSAPTQPTPFTPPTAPTAPTTPTAPTSGCSSSTSSGAAAPNPEGCEDRRDGTFNASWDQSTCQSHGYFYCTLSNSCTDQTVNINECLAR